MSLPKNCPSCGSDDPKRWDHQNVPHLCGCNHEWHELWHEITERSSGPDLHDLVRLIEYLREHDIGGVWGTSISGNRDWMSVRFRVPNSGRPRGQIAVEEGKPTEAHFVGPDGTVYDANREAL